ncbi:hypothetical protein HX776_24430 [Pseudomonas agarici]|uniref:hypothetical protein n=1 Tax=Pseudomonas agarici TaxID=46677 RepID=UPI00031C3BE8|nr:hypothetical protein [Pseudomonas agarici]NWC11938.1 hypothetical protein [Pseudomonas agarici]SEL85655.1 hypothetical protein SAMN05216604_14025 [Pseudomonas agarici]
MARKVSQYTVQNEGRDLGKTFQITEMPSGQAEEWALRAFLAMIKEGIELPDDFMGAGMAGLARMGFTFVGKLPFDTAKLLLDEMFQCVQIMPNPNDKSVVRNLIADDIEEVATRVKLRLAIWKLHVDFSKAVAPSTSAQA